MGKRKKNTDPHTELVGVRFTPAQRKALEEQARPVPLSTYLRQLLIKRSRPQSVPAINLETYQEIQKMSVILMQINQAFSTAIQQGQILETKNIQEWLTALQDIKGELKRIGMSAITADLEAVEQESGSDEFTL
ncbi:hypothetical protein LEP3755_66190 (plasmid) [Leptolyngbya sp. NIES-3755]|nr:hypothetical protein LEP3755_66190 [Leptolyngbya sp. NIES-3755]